MAFGAYTAVDLVLKKHDLQQVNGTVIRPVADAPPFSDAFRAELEFTYRELPVRRSEAGCGEMVLFPILKEVWRAYIPHLGLFSHEPLEYDDDLTGTPDYFICKRSPHGATIPDTPYLLVMEAKLDDFERAWGQCLAAMLAAQKINATPDQPIYGIATNGKSWEFAVLLEKIFTQQQESYNVADLDRLGPALHAAFRACRDLAISHTKPTPVLT